MLSALRPRSIYDVFSAIACAVALAGGTAYAAATITGADVVNETLTGSDVKGRPATSGGPAVDGSLTGYDIKDSSITGKDVNESTLALRPTPIEVGYQSSPTDGCVTATPPVGQFCGSMGPGGTAWFNYGNGYQKAAYFRDFSGIVHLQGSVAGGGSGTIFVLPPGYRPSAVRLFGVYDSSTQNTNYGYVTVYPSGRVLYKDGATNISTYLQLDGISFRV